MTISRKAQGITCALLSAGALSLEWYFARKLGDTGLTTTQFLFGMSVLTVLLLLITQGKHCFEKKLTTEEAKFLLIRNIVSASSFLSFFYAVQYTEVYKVLLLWQVYVFPVAFFSVFLFGERWSWMKTAALVSSLIGIFLLFYNGKIPFLQTIGFADWLALAAGFFHGAVFLYDRQTAAIPSVQRVFIQFSFFSVVFGILMITQRMDFLSLLHPTALFWMFCLALFPAIFTEFFRLEAIRRIELSGVSMILYTEPVMSIVLAWLIANETMSALQIVGGVFILAGILLASRLTKALDCGDNVPR